jgi:hypothetical protein
VMVMAVPPVFAGLDGFAGGGAAYLAGGHEGTPGSAYLLLVRPAIASRLVLSADAPW